MARRPTARSRLLALLDRYEEELQRVFRDAVSDLRSNAEIGRIAEMLERGDIEGALRAVHVDPAVFRELEAAIARAYSEGGAAATNSLPALRDVRGGRVIIRFDARNPRAEDWLRRHSSNLVTAIVDDQRTAIREALRAGMEAGRNPRSTALDIVGRIDRSTGRRAGGIVGLTSGQARSVELARQELASGDSAQLRNYLTRKVRDKRYDRAVLRAISTGEPLPAETVQRAAARYSDSLLRLRGETIARTESIASLNAASREAFAQAVESGGVNERDVRRVWRTASDSRVRESHARLNGESRGLNERFSNGLLYPGEPGMPAAEVVNCRCVIDTRIDFLANLE